jgi:hypothetical protein
MNVQHELERPTAQRVYLLYTVQAGTLHVTVCSTEYTEFTELQPLLSGLHSIMSVKLALAGEGGGCTPTPFYYIYHHQ